MGFGNTLSREFIQEHTATFCKTIICFHAYMAVRLPHKSLECESCIGYSRRLVFVASRMAI